MRRSPIVIATVLALVTTNPSVSHSADGVFPGGQPVILGKVTRITSHSVVVLTRDGESLPIEFDSRTVMATSMPTGCRVRVEFRLLDSGRYLAQRITPLERGSEAWAALDLRNLLPKRPKATRTIAPAVYSASSTEAQGATKTEEAEETPTEQTASEVASTDETSNASAGTDVAAASAEGDANVQGVPATRNPLPVILVTAMLMLVGLLLFRRKRRRA